MIYVHTQKHTCIYIYIYMFTYSCTLLNDMTLQHCKVGPLVMHLSGILYIAGCVLFGFQFQTGLRVMGLSSLSLSFQHVHGFSNAPFGRWCRVQACGAERVSGRACTVGQAGTTLATNPTRYVLTLVGLVGRSFH